MIIRLSRCLAWVGTPRFTEGLLDELQSFLPRMQGLLQEFCDRGVPYENSVPEVINLVVDAPTQHEQSGHFDVSFDESVYPLGCRDLDYKEPATGTIRFLLDLETGDLALEAERLPQRQCGLEEF